MKKVAILLALAAMVCSCATPKSRHEKILKEKGLNERIVFDGFKENGGNIVIKYNTSYNILKEYDLRTGSTVDCGLEKTEYEYDIDKADQYLWFISDNHSYLVTYSTSELGLKKEVDTPARLRKINETFTVEDGQDELEYKVENGHVQETRLYGVESFIQANNVSESEIIFREKRYSGNDRSFSDFGVIGYRSVIYRRGGILYQFVNHSKSADVLSRNCPGAVKITGENAIYFVNRENGIDYLMYYNGEYTPDEVDRGDVRMDFGSKKIYVSHSNGTKACYLFNGTKKSKSNLEHFVDALDPLFW